MSDGARSRRLSASVPLALVIVGVSVLVAAVVAAVRQDSRQPVWMIAGVPAVLVAVSGRATAKNCGRSRADRQGDTNA